MKVSQIFGQGGGYGYGGRDGSYGQVVFDDYRYSDTCYSHRYGGYKYCYEYKYDYGKSHRGGLLGIFG
jgi:hypothetical protein